MLLATAKPIALCAFLPSRERAASTAASAVRYNLSPAFSAARNWASRQSALTLIRSFATRLHGNRDSEMKATTGTTGAEHAGLSLGRAYRALRRRQAGLVGWLIGRGTPPWAAKTLLWCLNATLIAIAVWSIFWVVLLVTVAVVLAGLAQRTDKGQPPPRWQPNDPNDHRQSLFYHPLSYNDDPDPRFED